MHVDRKKSLTIIVIVIITYITVSIAIIIGLSWIARRWTIIKTVDNSYGICMRNDYSEITNKQIQLLSVNKKMNTQDHHFLLS